MKREIIGIMAVLGVAVVIGFLTLDNIKYIDDHTNITLIENTNVTEISYNTTTDNTTTIRCDYDYSCLSIDPNTNKSVLNARCINNTCINVSCQKDADCRCVKSDYVTLILYSICENGTCISVDCNYDGDCGLFRYKCVNNKCFNILTLGVQIAKSDYDMIDPQCDCYVSDNMCYCSDKVIDRPRQVIVNNNSIQILSEISHRSDTIEFTIKQEVIDRFIEVQ